MSEEEKEKIDNYFSSLGYSPLNETEGCVCDDKEIFLYTTEEDDSIGLHKIPENKELLKKIRRYEELNSY